jgi:hypothetical protein
MTASCLTDCFDFGAGNLSLERAAEVHATNRLNDLLAKKVSLNRR